MTWVVLPPFCAARSGVSEGAQRPGHDEGTCPSPRRTDRCVWSRTDMIGQPRPSKKDAQLQRLEEMSFSDLY